MGTYIDGWFYEDGELDATGRPKVRKHAGMVTDTTEQPGRAQPKGGYTTKIIEPDLSATGGITVQTKESEHGADETSTDEPTPAPSHPAPPLGRPGR